MGSGCYNTGEFESIFPCSSMVEQFAVNEKVLGSSPSGGAKIFNFRL